MTALLVLALAAAAVDAPVTAATVFSDRARVTRTASVTLGGSQRIEFPLLGGPVDTSSIRVESRGGEVQRVDIAWVEAEAFAASDARKLLAKLEKLDDERSHVQQERDTYQDEVNTLNRLAPGVPPSEPLKPVPKLNPAGWKDVGQFSKARLDAAQNKIRERDEKLRDLNRARAKLAEEARLLGGVGRKPGWKVTATVSGSGAAKVSLIYVVTQARWYPSYDIQLDAERSKVQVSFAGLVSQETGEDWTDAQLTLSTAVPAGAMHAPKLLAWKIGEKERFIPTPYPVAEQPPPPPPPVPPPPQPRAGDDELRQKVLALAGNAPPAEPTAQSIDALMGDMGAAQADAYAPSLGGLAMDEESGKDYRGVYDKKAEMKPMEKRKAGKKYDASKAPPAKNAPGRAYGGAPPPPPAAAAPAPSSRRDSKEMAFSETTISGALAREQVATMGVGLSPPPGWIAPSYGADTPVALSGGYDLSWQSLRVETVKSGQGTRRVALFSQSWPVTVERRIFPAMAPDAYLVAELKSPSPDALPGGQAHLFVGADPAGDARLQVIAPGEKFTLPLGIDRAIQPKRNVNLVQEEKGFIGKDELTTYEVEVELANPYKKAVAVRILDQIPVTDDKNVEVKLLRTDPSATFDKVKGQLEWIRELPANAKTVLKFSYSIRRPKGWRMHQ